MLGFIKRFVTAILSSRFVVRLYAKELKIGIRDYLMSGNVQMFLNTCHPNKKFEGITALAKMAKHYRLPVRIHTWYRHEDGVRHSYFVPTDICISPSATEAELVLARERLEGSRDKFVALAICEPNAELKTLHPITM